MPASQRKKKRFWTPKNVDNLKITLLEYIQPNSGVYVLAITSARHKHSASEKKSHLISIVEVHFNAKYIERYREREEDKLYTIT